MKNLNTLKAFLFTWISKADFRDRTKNPIFTSELTEGNGGFNPKNRMKTNWSEKAREPRVQTLSGSGNSFSSWGEGVQPTNSKKNGKPRGGLATISKIVWNLTCLEWGSRDSISNVWHRGKQGCNFHPKMAQIFADYKSIVSHEVTKSQRILNSDKNRKNFDLDQNQSIEKNDLRKRVYESRLFQCFGFVRMPERISSVFNAINLVPLCLLSRRRALTKADRVRNVLNAFLSVFMSVHPWLKTALNAFKSMLNKLILLYDTLSKISFGFVQIHDDSFVAQLSRATSCSLSLRLIVLSFPSGFRHHVKINVLNVFLPFTSANSAVKKVLNALNCRVFRAVFPEFCIGAAVKIAFHFQLFFLPFIYNSQPEDFYA